MNTNYTDAHLQSAIGQALASKCLSIRSIWEDIEAPPSVKASFARAFLAALSKPTTPWTLPTPPPGQKWHREDWTQEKLPDGYRPLLEDEPWMPGDEILRYNEWHVAGQHEDDAIGSPTTKYKCHCRTRRPLPAQVNVEPAKDQPTQSQQVWTPKPGDVVRLKSGGPKMAVDTVAEPDEHREGQLVYGCFWIAEDGRPQAFKLPAVLLQPAN